MEIRNWMTKTTAAEIMVRDVATVWQTHTLAQAAAVLLREQISGMPVVNEEGVCVGVISLMDILRAEEIVADEQQKVASSSYFDSALTLPTGVYAERLEELRDKLAPASGRFVKEFMTTDLVSVPQDTQLDKIVTSMVDAHIHRLLVLDADRHLQGIVTTIDVLAALMRASQKA